MLAMRKSTKRRNAPGPRATSARARPWPARGSVAMLIHLEFWASPANQALRGLPAKLSSIVGPPPCGIKRLGGREAPGHGYLLRSGARQRSRPCRSISAFQGRADKARSSRTLGTVSNLLARTRHLAGLDQPGSPDYGREARQSGPRLPRARASR